VQNRTGHERIRDTPPNLRNLPLRIHVDIQQDQRRYNPPAVDEIAAIIPGDGTDADNTRDIILHRVGGALQRISETHPAYTPLHYVLLYPNGEYGWHVGIPFHNDQAAEEGEGHDEVRNNNNDNDEDPGIMVVRRRKVTKVSHTRFHAYRLFKRELQDANGQWVSDSSLLLHGGMSFLKLLLYTHFTHTCYF
jgi:hypothetical protein